ncbi:MAG: crotonase/enoyl-CoA hydratase family protein [Acidimicrobiales bacterium]
MPDAPVTLERRDAVLIAHLDDGRANALSRGTIRALQDAIDAAEGDASVSALVLHGRPGKFCAGFDLDVMRGGDIAAISELVADGGALVRRTYGCSVPVVAACTGHALAAGALLLLGCDLRIGADVDCKIGLNEVAIGMVLPDWAMTISAERLSRRHLQQAVALARVTDGRGAIDAGFLDQVVPEADVLEAAVAAGVAMAGLSRLAYAGTVRSLRGGVLERMDAQIAADRRAGSIPGV